MNEYSDPRCQSCNAILDKGAEVTMFGETYCGYCALELGIDDDEDDDDEVEEGD